MQQGTNIKSVSSELTSSDIWTHFKLRWGVGRDNSIVEPGIYSVGNPGPDSQLFVSANYSMSFNKLRVALKGLDAWIMVIDTKGINVWCAAGKGTFGTEEIVKRIKGFDLKKLINHKKIIVPQLGAPGVSAYKVQEETGFTIVYGPVRAEDIKPFLKKGLEKSKVQKKVNFNFIDRIELIPVELRGSEKHILWSVLFLYLISMFYGFGFSFSNMMSKGTVLVGSFILAAFAGFALTPMLLPFIRFRSFALKGYFLGLLLQILYFSIYSGFLSVLQMLGAFIAFPAVSAYLALNFTGCTTYTSPSGVRREISIFLRPIRMCMLIGFIILSLATLGGI